MEHSLLTQYNIQLSAPLPIYPHPPLYVSLSQDARLNLTSPAYLHTFKMVKFTAALLIASAAIIAAAPGSGTQDWKREAQVGSGGLDWKREALPGSGTQDWKRGSGTQDWKRKAEPGSGTQDWKREVHSGIGMTD
jgi:hypothetical protein